MSEVEQSQQVKEYWNKLYLKTNEVLKVLNGLTVEETKIILDFIEKSMSKAILKDIVFHTTV